MVPIIKLNFLLLLITIQTEIQIQPSSLPHLSMGQIQHQEAITQILLYLHLLFQLTVPLEEITLKMKLTQLSLLLFLLTIKQMTHKTTLILFKITLQILQIDVKEDVKNAPYRVNACNVDLMRDKIS
jgi:hypothetical protein